MNIVQTKPQRPVAPPLTPIAPGVPPLTPIAPVVPPLTPIGPVASVDKPFSPPIQGDPATQRFGFIFFGVLAVATIGAGIGIGVGNMSHYRYFPSTNEIFNLNNTAIFDIINNSTRPRISLILILSSTIFAMKILFKKNLIS